MYPHIVRILKIAEYVGLTCLLGIPAGRLPVYAILAFPPGTMMAPLDTSKMHERKEEEMPRIWDRDSQSPSIVDSVEIFEYRGSSCALAITKTDLLQNR